MKAIFLCLFFGLIVCGCRLQKRPTLVSRYKADKGIELAVPMIRGGSPHCGACAAAMVLNFYGDDCLPTEFFSLIEKEEGISNRALAATLRKRGYECYNLEGTKKQLAQLVQRQIPPILLLGAGKKYHYVVLTGFSRKGELAALNNPFSGREVVTVYELLAKWKASQNSLLVIAQKAD